MSDDSSERRRAYMRGINTRFHRAMDQRDFNELTHLVAMISGLFRHPTLDIDDPYPELAEAFDNAALWLFLTGQDEEAESLYRRALEMRRSLFGEEAPWVAVSLENLARVHQKRHQDADASSLLQQALESYLQNRRGPTRDRRKPLHQKRQENPPPTSLRQSGQAEAPPDRTPPLVSREESLRSIEAFAAGDYENCVRIGLPLLSQGAGLDLLQVLLISLQRLGREEPARRLGADVLAATEDHPWSHALVQLTLGRAILADVLPLAHNDDQRCQAHYYAGARLRTVGQIEPALAHFDECLARPSPCLERHLAQAERNASPPTHEEAFGGDSRQQVLRLSNRAEQFFHQGRFAEAISLAVQACDLACRHLGENSEEHLGCLHNLGALYQMQGNHARAKEVQTRALELRRQVLGEDHPDFATALNNLAALHEEMDDFAAAEPLHQQALAIRRRTLGESHPDCAVSLNNLGVLYSRLGDLSAAESFLSQALELRRQVLGESHPDFAQSLVNLAWVHRSRGHHALARPLLRQALEVYRRSCGVDHPSYQEIHETLRKLPDEGSPTTKAPDHPAQEALEGCVAAYLNRDYTECVQLAMPLLSGGPSHELLQLLLISLQRLHQLESLDKLPRLILGQVESPWHRTLLRLSLGEVSPPQALALAEGEEQRCQAHYYAGARLLTEGQEEAARTELSRCLACAADCVERRLAQGEYDWLTSAREEGGAEDVRTQRLRVLEARTQALHEAGKFEEAHRLARQAYEVAREQGEEDADLARVLGNLALLEKHLGDYPAAEQHYRTVCDLIRTTAGEEDPLYATNLNNLAQLYRVMGRLDAALPLCRQALEILRRTGRDEERGLLATVLSNLGGLYADMHDVQAAIPLLREALEVRRATLGVEHPDYAQSLNALAMIYSDLGWISDAESLYRQAREALRAGVGERHPHFALVLNNLGNLYHAKGDFEAAEQLLCQALEVRRQALGEQHPDFAQTLSNLAEVYASRKNPVAEAFMRQACEAWRAACGPNHPDVVVALMNRALFCAQQGVGRSEEALGLMQEAAVIDDHLLAQVLSVGSERQRLVYLQRVRLHLEGFLSLALRQLASSATVACSAFDLVLRRKQLGVEAFAAQRDAILAGRYPEARAALEELAVLRMRIARRTLAGPGPEGRLQHQKVLVEWTARKEQVEADLAQRVREIRLEQKLQASDRRALALALPPGAALIEYVRVRICDFQAEEVRGAAPEAPAHYLAFLLTAGEPDLVQMLDLGEAGRIDPLIAEFRSAITGTPEQARGLIGAPAATAAVPGDAKGAELRAAVFDPLLTRLGGCRRLFLAPDGDLTRLPFEVLPTNTGRLIDDYHLSYLGTGRDVLRFDASPGASPAPPVVVADPDFDLRTPSPAGPVPSRRGGLRSWLSGWFGRSRQAESQPASSAVLPVPDRDSGRRSRDLAGSRYHFGPLPGTRLEGERIAALLGVRPRLQGEAVEAVVKGCRSPRVLHLATHGFFLPDQSPAPTPSSRDIEVTAAGAGSDRLAGPGMEDPLLRSGLALAGANTWLSQGALPADAEDGLLTAEDVCGLDLLGTELAVLSACETGLGEVRVGEGVFGLRRAFVLAGARALVMSLWKVPDEQTQELMVDFYCRILAGEPRAEALRCAQQALKEKYPEPFYWGAFICQGNPGPLPALP